jgi:hypothetical protein
MAKGHFSENIWIVRGAPKIFRGALERRGAQFGNHCCILLVAKCLLAKGKLKNSHNLHFISLQRKKKTLDPHENGKGGHFSSRCVWWWPMIECQKISYYYNFITRIWEYSRMVTTPALYSKVSGLKSWPTDTLSWGFCGIPVSSSKCWDSDSN